MRKRPKLTEYRFDQWADDLKSWITESVSPFEDDTPEKQAQRKKRGKYDLLYFCATYLPHYFTSEFGEFHEEWEELTEIRDESVFVAAPREHAKSTFFTLGVPIRNVCYALRWFQLIISDTNDQATGFTLAIRSEMEENPRLKHDFGDLKSVYGRRSVTWKKNDFTSSNSVRTLARGRGEKVRGLKNRQYRPDFAVVDDFENDENVENPKLVTKGKRWLTRAVIGSMGAGYTFLMIGNLFHPKSVLSQFITQKDEDNSLLYVSRVYRAWIDYNKPGQRPLWPALWPEDRLEKKRRQMGTVDFNAEMMNLTGAEDSPFPEKWFVFYEIEEISGKTLFVATFVDPSAKSGESNDFKAIITVGLDRTTMIFYVLHAWIRHASPGEMFAASYRQHDEYGGSVGIEENMLHDFLHEAIFNYAKDVGRYLPWQPVNHSTNKEARIIGTLSYLVEYGKLRFCKNHSDQDLLREQLVYILNKNINDDGPDGLEGAVNMLQGGAGAIPVVISAGARQMGMGLEGYQEKINYASY
jgi:predicted phage terminase large subunit-like protein